MSRGCGNEEEDKRLSQCDGLNPILITISIFGTTGLFSLPINTKPGACTSLHLTRELDKNDLRLTGLLPVTLLNANDLSSCWTIVLKSPLYACLPNSYQQIPISSNENATGL